MILLYILFGILFITVGATLLNCISEILVAVTELIKANISERIVRHTLAISELSGEEPHIRPIGFATTFEEEDEDEL